MISIFVYFLLGDKIGLHLLFIFSFIISKLFLELHTRKRLSILFSPEEKTHSS